MNFPKVSRTHELTNFPRVKKFLANMSMMGKRRRQDSCKINEQPRSKELSLPTKKSKVNEKRIRTNIRTSRQLNNDIGSKPVVAFSNPLDICPTQQRTNMRQKQSQQTEEKSSSLPSKQGIVYALELKNGFKYIGWTARSNLERIDEHINGEGSKWTKLHGFVGLLEQFPGTEEDEDKLTLSYMKKYGWWKVRGGKWCAVNMRFPPKELSPSGCSRCGRKNHTTNQCFAKTHVSDNNDKYEYYDYSDSSDDDYDGDLDD